jgi:uncharacterized protein (DUF58 family)
VELDTKTKIVVYVGGLAVAGVALYGLSKVKSAAGQPTAQITISAPSTDTVGQAVTVTATYTVNNVPQANVPLYLFYYYSQTAVSNPQSIPSSSFTLASTETTNSSGQASWSFTPTEAGYYYLDVSNNANNT